MIRQLISLLDNLIYPLVIVMSMWVVYLFNLHYSLHLNELGLRPHARDGWSGIIFMPLLHENLEHLFSNSVPILVAGFFLFYYFKNWSWVILGSIWTGSGIILWFLGSEGTLHIGASGLVYGLVFFMLVSGLIRRNRELAAIALLMVFLYGGLVWGLFPEYVRLLRENISWEGHVGGAVMGSIMALALLKKGPPAPKMHDPEEEEDEEEFPYWMTEQHPEVQDEQDKLPPEQGREIKIRYHFLPGNEGQDTQPKD